MAGNTAGKTSGDPSSKPWRHWGLLGLLAVGLAGCTSFDRDWRRAAATPPGGGRLEGRWEGEWESDVNHHRGALRCIVTPLSNEVYSARFHAKYRRLVNLTFSYTARLEARPEARPEAERVTFSGEADLGWYAGGLYRYQGHATATNFQSTYSSRYDHGTFRLSRPQ